jgi:hypothetical protein
MTWNIPIINGVWVTKTERFDHQSATEGAGLRHSADTDADAADAARVAITLGGAQTPAPPPIWC